MKILRFIKTNKKHYELLNGFFIVCLVLLFEGYGPWCGDCLGQETADIISNWTNSRYSDDGEFYFGTGINCGDPNQDGRDPVNSTDTYHTSNSGNSILHIGVTDQVRFSGTHSVMMYTDANIYATCNQNFSVERCEIWVSEDWRASGRAQEGNTVWMGWSEKWTDIDESHWATILQFRSNCGSGSPATEIYLKPNRVLQLSTRQDPVHKIIGTLQEDVWYDWIVEIKYSKGYDGYIKVWWYQAGNPENYSYSDPPAAQILNNPTMLSTDGCPHLRWGVYRWESGDLTPSQILPADRMAVKYVGPTRWKYGNNLGATGFEAVKPRSPGGGSPPNVPTLSSPTNGATDQPISLTLDWNSVSNATSYDYQVSTNSSFSPLVESGNTTSTQVNISGLSYGTTYYWRVRAVNSYGSSAWSSYRTFTTETDTWAGSQESSNTSWQNFTMESQTGSFTAEFDTRANTSNMNGVTGLADIATACDTYDDLACIVRFNDSGQIDVRNGTAYTSDVTVNYAAGDVFHVRMEVNVATHKYDVFITPEGGSEVQIAANYDFRSDQSSVSVLNRYVLRCEILSHNVKDFTVTAGVTPPDVPTLSSPANNATDQPLSLNLVWNSVSDATSYDYQVSTVSDFSSLVKSGNTASTQVNISGLSNETTYYWRVRALNSGGSSAWSSYWTFTTIIAPPATPTLSSPVDNATDQPLSLDLVWNSVSTATSYDYQVSKSSDFSSLEKSGNTTSTQVNISGLSYATTYYWRVRALNAGGSSAWSASRTFTTTTSDPWAGSLESSNTSWQNFEMTSQTGSFTAEFDTRANTSNMNGVTGLADIATDCDTYDDLACIVRFNTDGQVDVRNGTAYASDVTVNYVAGDVFHVRMEVNISTHKYDVFITPEGGSEVHIADNYDFREDQSGVSVLNRYVLRCEILSHNVKDFSVSSAPPAVPTLSSPADNATDQPLSLDLVWNSVSTATSYDYQLSTVSDFSSLEESGNTASTQVNVSGLSTATTYYWRVRALNAGGSSAWSGSWSFTTVTDPWAGSLESSNTSWQNFEMTSQTGSFTAEFDTRANTSNMNGVTGLADIATDCDTYDDLACIVRFNTDGQVDVRNGTAYASDVTVNYVAGDVFHVRMEVNVSTHKYDVFITPEGGSEVHIADNYDFREDQSSVSVLNRYVLRCEILSHNVKDFTTSLSKNIAEEDDDEIMSSEMITREFVLMQNHPNPFNPTTTIAFTVPEATEINLSVYNQRGQLIRTLYSGAISAGVHRVVWDAMDEHGVRVSSGIYLYKLEAKDFVTTKKLVFTK